MKEIIDSVLVKNTIKSLFNDKETEILARPASYIIRLKNEGEDKVERIILLPPNGFTSNKINETSPHPEARRAKITIKGAVRADKRGFNILKNVIRFSYYTKRDIKIKEESPYTLINKKNSFYREETKSSRETFFVAKENGEGFFHNLINLSDEWILLILKKELRLQKEMDINSKIKNLEKGKQKIIVNLIETIKSIGDKVFDKNKELVDNVLKLDINEAIPALIEALNIYETGKHEPCTVYAIILKFAKKEPNEVMKFLKSALENNEAPKYYLEELIEKIE